MELWLVLAALISLFFGIILILSPETLRKLNEVANRPIVILDKSIAPYHTTIGVVLLIAGVFIIYSVWGVMLPYWYVVLIGLISLLFGALFLSFGNALKLLNEVGNRLLLSTDELVINLRRVVGGILILAGLYIFISAFLGM